MATTTNYTSMAYIEESVEGETPATPEFQLLPTTGGSPVSNITTAVSEVIRPDRQTDDLTITDSEVGGEINYELSYEPYKPLMIALLQNDTSGSISVAAASVDGVDFTKISSAGVEGLVSIGDVFRVSSALDDAIDGFYTCTDNSVADEITIYPAMASTMTAQSDVEITATEVIVNGANTPKSYTFKKTALSDAVTNLWYYRGIKISSMNWNFATGSILNGTFSVMGRTEEATITPIAGQQPDLPVADYSIMNSVTSIGTIYLEGVSLGTCSFESLDLNYDNQVTSAKSIGTLGACDNASYSVQITGSVSVFFKDLSLYNKFLDAEAFGVTIILEDGDENSIGINMPKCKFESLDTPIDGKDNFLKQSGSFRALREATDNYMFKLSFIDKL